MRWIPAGPLDGLNVTYDSRGRLSAWWRGDLAVTNVYDETSGLVVERRIADRILRRFIYKTANKVTSIHGVTIPDTSLGGVAEWLAAFVA